ncbi:MAG: flagellar basal body rod protein FlgF [Burkholderiaceae bacterium]|nr:flagellar basal body rod protein FlgF [Burkholderiaceae bacterium]
MDRIAYTAMTGAKHTMGQLATTSNNMANVHTPGFREQVAAFRAVPLEGEQADSRAFVVDSTPTAYFNPGAIESTDNPFDVAIATQGFFAVRRADGSEVYTRNGRFFRDENGVLRIGRDVSVMGEGGEITIPRNAEVEISNNGIVWVRENGEQRLNQVAQLKLVNPNIRDLVRAEDGFFELPKNQPPAELDASVRVRQGAYETSNVNAANAMVQMINQTRMFELNMRVIQTAEQNSRQANILMTLSNF